MQSSGNVAPRATRNYAQNAAAPYHSKSVSVDLPAPSTKFTVHNRVLCIMAGRVKSPMAASEHVISQNLDLADWPVWRKLIDRLGSRRDRPPFGFIAGKRSVRFRFPEAANHQLSADDPQQPFRFSRATSAMQRLRTVGRIYWRSAAGHQRSVDSLLLCGDWFRALLRSSHWGTFTKTGSRVRKDN